MSILEGEGIAFYTNYELAVGRPCLCTLRPEVFFCQIAARRISAVVTGGGMREILFLSFGNSFNETTSILEGRVVKVPHSTRTTILQLVDPACAAAQEHVETRIWNFIFCQFFSAKLRLGRISAVVTGGEIIYFFSIGNYFNETSSILEGRIVKGSHSTRTANLQLVDPDCAAAQEHVETRIWNFHFLSVFSAKLRLGRISAVVTGGGIRFFFFDWQLF